MNERGLDDDEWLKSMIDRLEEESKQGLISDGNVRYDSMLCFN